MDIPTAHALLRDRLQWRGERHGLSIAGPGACAGDLILAQVPGPGDGKAVVLATQLPYLRIASGIAAGPCAAVFIADTANNRILYIDGLCGDAKVWLPADTGNWPDAPGHFRRPRGLACVADALLVADSGNGRVQHMVWPRLEASQLWADWAEPVSLAIDSGNRLLLVDAASGLLHRVRPGGQGDAAFDAAIVASGRLAQPLFVATDAADRVLVSDVQHNTVCVFNADGSFLLTLPGPSGWLPGALATAGDQVYVADAKTGSILVFEMDETGAVLIGSVAGWQGPVTALAEAGDGSLLIKPDLGANFYRYAAQATYVASGSLTAGPFDAGEDRFWERAFSDADLPAGTSVSCEIAVAATAAPAPGPSDWVALPSADALLALFTADSRRFARLRLTLTTTDYAVTPRLLQARLATAAEDYLDYLPLTYRYNDGGGDGFLSRWLRLMRSEFSRVEEALDDMPRVADPQFEAPDSLAWLAKWLGLELPQIANDGERRALIGRAVQLFARRGTPQSIAEFVKLHTGIAPTIIEAFSDRRIWILGQSSRLDFDTRLPALDPLGMIVPDPSVEAGCCPALAPVDDIASGSPCGSDTGLSEAAVPVVAIGRAVVGESGPLASYQLGLPLFAEEAYRFCVLVDGYRAGDPQTVQEITRIVEREKPAHTDFRIELIVPDLRVGLQARVGIDTIVGGEPPALQLGQATLGLSANLPPPDVARIASASLDGSLILS